MIVTTPFSVCGYSLTLSVDSARKPSTRISRLTTEASTGRSIKISVNFIGGLLLFLRRRVRAVGRQHAVVDHERRAVLQLQLATRHDLRAFADALEYRDLIAARRPGRDEHL